MRRVAALAMSACLLLAAGCVSRQVTPGPPARPAPFDASRLTSDELQVLERVDAIGASVDASGTSDTGRLLVAVDLRPFAESVASGGVTGSGVAMRSLKDFDRVYASRGATATYEAMRTAWAHAYEGDTMSDRTASLAAVMDSVIEAEGLFRVPRAFVDPVGQATAPLSAITVSGNTAKLVYGGGDTTRTTVPLDLTRRPDGTILIAGLQDVPWRQ